MNVAVAYGGREEIVEAVRSHLQSELAKGREPAEITDELSVEKISPHLYTSELPDPDLIIRTSGECDYLGFALAKRVFRILLLRYVLAII